MGNISTDKREIDWDAIRVEYIITDTTYQKIADRYKIRIGTVYERSKKEGWREARKKHKEKTVKKTIKKIEKKKADKIARIQRAGDRLLAKVEKAIDEVDIHLYKEVIRTKTIEYNNDKRPDKPTKEVVEEKESLNEVRKMIDRKALRDLAAALNALKEIQMLRADAADLNAQEQLLRIERLKREAERVESSATNSVEVVFSAEEEEWAK